MGEKDLTHIIFYRTLSISECSSTRGGETFPYCVSPNDLLVVDNEETANY